LKYQIYCMATKSLDNQILQYLPLLGKDEKQSLLSVIRSFLKGREPQTRLTIEEYNKELEAAEARIDAGEYYTHEEVVERSKKW
jgi:hypothetical protein